MRLDVYLLADCLASFRKACLDKFKLDPFHYLGIAHFGFSAMLKHTGVTLEKIADVNMILFAETAILGGLSSALEERLFEAEPGREAIQVDINSAYGWAMMQMLPIGGYTWITESSELASIDWRRHSEMSGVGYLVECDLEIPDHLHDHFNGFPPCPEKMTVNGGMLSRHMRDCLTDLDHDPERFARQTLTATLSPKKGYKVHSRLLALYLRLGVRLTRVHRAVRFRTAAFLEPYIQKLAEMRRRSSSDFHKRIYKTLIVIIYGKMIADTRKYVSVSLMGVRQSARISQVASKPQCESFRYLSPDVVAFFSHRQTIRLDKQYFVAITILDLTRALLYEDIYTVFRPALGNPRLIYHDTDSVSMSFDVVDGNDIADTRGLRAVLRRLSKKLDFSNFPPDDPLYDRSRENIPGYWKIEHGGPLWRIFMYAAVRAKNYAISLCPRLSADLMYEAHVAWLKSVSGFDWSRYNRRGRRGMGATTLRELLDDGGDDDDDDGGGEEEEEDESEEWEENEEDELDVQRRRASRERYGISFKQKAKGVPKRSANREMRPEHYRAAGMAPVSIPARCKSFRSYNHTLYTICMRKLAVSSADCKRYVLRCSRHSLAYGHKDIRALSEIGDLCKMCDGPDVVRAALHAQRLVAPST